MDPGRKKSMRKKEMSEDEKISSLILDKLYARPPTTGTSSSASDDKNSSSKSSEATSPEDQNKIIPIENERLQGGMVYCSIEDQKKGLDLKFDATPSAFFSNRNDAATDIASPLDGNRVPSPSSISSLTSRPLEWDSGADVGYSAHGADTGLSTIERIALAQGSAILFPRSDPEGTTETAQKTNLKVVCPAVKRIIGPPTAESTVIKDSLFSSPLPDSKNYYPDGISPILSSVVNGKSRMDKPAEFRQQSSSPQPTLKNLSSEKGDQHQIEELTHEMELLKCNSPHLHTDEFPENPKTQDSLSDGNENSRTKIKKQLYFKARGGEISESEVSIVESSVRPLNRKDKNSSPLKKSVSCSNLQLISNQTDLKFLKPLKLQPHTSASSSSVSTVIDKSRGKSNQSKLLISTNSITEKTSKQKLFKLSNKVASPTKQKHFAGSTVTSKSSKNSASNLSNIVQSSSYCKQPSPQNSKSSNEQPFENENNQFSVHTSIQQSILDGLQQCIQEISATFDNTKKNSCNDDRISSMNLGDNLSSLKRDEKDVALIPENCGTLGSVTSVQTNDSWTVGSNTKDSLNAEEKARSFEYLPGDLYEKNSSAHHQNQKKSGSTSSASDKIYSLKDFSESSKEEFLNSASLALFEREMERGINILKDYINNATNLSVQKKNILLKKIAKKLMSSDYENSKNCTSDENSTSLKSKNSPRKASDTYYRSRILDRSKFVKESSSELSHATRISSCYLDTSSECSNLNLVSKTLKKSTSLESSSKNSEVLPSGIQYIQENYQSNNCTFDSDSESIVGTESCSDKVKVANQYLIKSLDLNADNNNRLAAGGVNQTYNRYSSESISVDWSKSSSLYENHPDGPAILLKADKQQFSKTKPSQELETKLPDQNCKDLTDSKTKKVIGSKFSPSKCSKAFVDRRFMSSKSSSFKPFSNTQDKEMSKKFSYPSKYDWKIPTSDSERKYEEKLVKRKEKQSELLFNYLDAERKNHLLWIQSEINHLSNLKALIEKQEKIKEGLKLLKSKKSGSKIMSTSNIQHKQTFTQSKIHSEKFTESSRVQSNNFIHTSERKPGFKETDTFTDKSSDKENKDTLNKNQRKTISSQTTSTSRFINRSANKSKSKLLCHDIRDQVSSYEPEKFLSAESDGTNNTWSENKCIQICDNCHRKTIKKNTTFLQKQKTSHCICKKRKPISYVILFDSPKQKFASKTHTPSQQHEHKILRNTNSSSTTKISETTPLTLQECLAVKHPEVIRQAEFRRKCIAELAALRQYQNENKKRLVLALNSENSSSDKILKSSSSLPSMKEKRIFSQKKLRQQTEKKYRQTYEVKQKLKELKEKENHRTNRLMAATFARKLQRKVLKGTVNLSNSVMVIDG